MYIDVYEMSRAVMDGRYNMNAEDADRVIDEIRKYNENEDFSDVNSEKQLCRKLMTHMHEYRVTKLSQ